MEKHLQTWLDTSSAKVPSTNFYRSFFLHSNNGSRYRRLAKIELVNTNSPNLSMFFFHSMMSALSYHAKIWITKNTCSAIYNKHIRKCLPYWKFSLSWTAVGDRSNDPFSFYEPLWRIYHLVGPISTFHKLNQVPF